MDVCSKLRQEFKLLPEKYSIVSEMEKEENNLDVEEIIQNIRMHESFKDYLAIPTTDEIIKQESYTQDEMSDMMRQYNGLNFKVTKAFQKELDSVVHPNDEYSSSDAHHQPHFTQAEDLEYSIREMFQEYRHTFYKPEQHLYDQMKEDSSIYNMTTYHDFDGAITYDTFMFKLLVYYSMLYRIFKLEYFTCKSAAKPLDILHLERYVYNGSDYWKNTERADFEVAEQNIDFEIYSESDDSRSGHNTVSKSIIQQIVQQKRRRVKLQDDLENLYESMIYFKKSIGSLQDKKFDSILEFISLYHDNRFFNVVYSIDKCLERVFNTQVPQELESTSFKQIESLHHLKKKISNKYKKYIPWFNHRYY